LNASVENGVDALLQAGCLRTQILRSVLLNGAGRSYDDLSRVSKPGDQSISHPQPKVFVATFCAQGLERKHGKRTNCCRALHLDWDL